jgi:hypothetical protein
VNTGTSNDAELFGIAAARELGVERVKQDEVDSDLVLLHGNGGEDW